MARHLCVFALTLSAHLRNYLFECLVYLSFVVPLSLRLSVIIERALFGFDRIGYVMYAAQISFFTVAFLKGVRHENPENKQIHPQPRFLDL